MSYKSKKTPEQGKTSAETSAELNSPEEPDAETGAALKEKRRPGGESRDSEGLGTGQSADTESNVSDPPPDGSGAPQNRDAREEADPPSGEKAEPEGSSPPGETEAPVSGAPAPDAPAPDEEERDSAESAPKEG